MIDGRAWQGLRLGPRIIAAEPLAAEVVKQVQGIAQPALAQELPEPVAVFAGHVAQVTEFRVWTIIPWHQDQLHPAPGQFHQALNAIAPIADAAVQRQQDDLGVLQHVFDIQIH
ncbi:hypothetical protein D3C78_1574720 [compost metagenome]